MNRWIAAALIAAAWLHVQTNAVHAQGRSVTLEWTAPGDDGSIGKAQNYDVRVSRLPITASNFSLATHLNTSMLPGPSGTKERLTVFNLTYGVAYYFAVKTADDIGNWSLLSNIAYAAATAAGVDDAAPAEPQFAAPRPNPSRARASFSVTLPHADRLLVEAFDLAGRRVRTIAVGEYSGGTFDVRWDLRDDTGHMLGAGTYLVRGQLGENVFLRRVTVVR